MAEAREEVVGDDDVERSMFIDGTLDVEGVRDVELHAAMHDPVEVSVDPAFGLDAAAAQVQSVHRQILSYVDVPFEVRADLRLVEADEPVLPGHTAGLRDVLARPAVLLDRAEEVRVQHPIRELLVAREPGGCPTDRAERLGAQHVVWMVDAERDPPLVEVVGHRLQPRLDLGRQRAGSGEPVVHERPVDPRPTRRSQ